MKLVTKVGLALPLVLSSLPNSFAESSGAAEWEPWKYLMSFLAVIISIVAARFSYLAVDKTQKLSQSIADRTVTIEAQKLLLEINKQFVSDPALLSLYSDYQVSTKDADRKDLPDKVKALAFMNINVFEIVFAALPSGDERKTWVAYFDDTLLRCPTVRDELHINPKIYGNRLIAEYERWKEAYPDIALKISPASASPARPSETPP